MVDTLSGIIIEDRLVQFEKVCSFISDRFSLSVIDDNASQLLNAFLPISLILLGSSIYFRLSQERYLQPIITQYFIDNKSEIWLLFLIAHSKR